MATLANRVKVSTSTTGTGTITLGSAEAGYQTFADGGIANGDVVSYTIEDGNNWEIGTGTYTASGTTLSRTVSESSNSGSAINLSGNAVVFVTASAADILTELVQDTTPQLGGNLDLNGHTFVGSGSFSGNVLANGGSLVAYTGTDTTTVTGTLTFGTSSQANRSFIRNRNTDANNSYQEFIVKSGGTFVTPLLVEGSGLDVTGNITSSGSIKSGTDGSSVGNLAATGKTSSGTAGQLNLQAGSGFWTNIKAASTGGNYTLTLPTADGTSGQVLTTDGSGQLSFATSSSGGGLSVLSTKTLDNPNAYNTSAGDNFGVSVAISGNYAIVGAEVEDDAGGSSSGKAYIFDVPSGSLLYTLDNPNAYSTSASDRFGVSVAISGNYAIVGAFFEDDAGGSSSGKAYIYDISTFTSSTITSANYVLNNPNAYSTSSSDYFGYSVAISGNYVIVGAFFEDDAGGSSSGKAYIYDISTFTSSTISSANYILNNPNAYSTSADDQFGYSVAISGNYAIVGALTEKDAGGSSSGKAYIYDISTFTPYTPAIISSANYVLNNPNAYGTSADDQFGYSVAISGNYAIVGALYEDDAGGSGSGKAYIYDISTFTSSTISSANYVLDDPNAYSTSADDRFGGSVEISGNYAIVGAYLEGDAGGSASGKAYIYDISKFSSSTITSADYVIDNPNAYSTSATDFFGYSVAISGNYAIVGAYLEDDAGGSSSGKAYIFKTNGEAYTYTPQEIHSFTPSRIFPNIEVAGIAEKLATDTSTSGTHVIYCNENSGRSTYFTNSFTANRTLNVKDISDQVYQNGSVTVSVIHNTGSGSYAFTTFNREGASITPIWAGGSAPTYSANKWVIVTLTFIWLGSSWGQTFASFNEFG